MQLLLVFVLLAPLCLAKPLSPPASAYKCLKGWTLDESSKSCIKRFHESKSWRQAKRRCRKQKSRLVKIASGHTEKTVRDLLQSGKRYWIGVHDRDKDGIYSYMDDTRVSFSRWSKKDPGYGKERCVMMMGNRRGAWKDKRCRQKRNFVCQKKAKMVLKCPGKWKLFIPSRTCILAFEDKKGWSDARAACDKNGGELVKLVSRDGSRFVREQMTRRHRYWIGAYDPDHDESFQYVDGSALASFHRWASREPNNHGGKEHCVEVIGNKRVSWNDKRCGKKRAFICEIDALIKTSRRSRS